MGVKPGRIEISIDTLVLHGYPTRDRARIAVALQEELSRLVSSGSLSPDLLAAGQLPVIETPALQTAPGARPEAIGQGIAQAIYEGLKR